MTSSSTTLAIDYVPIRIHHNAEKISSYLVIQMNSVCICEDFPVVILEPSHWNNQTTVFEACEFVNVVVAATSVIHRT